MSYLLIFFIVVVVLSPLAWLKGSPAQARMAAFRLRAGQLGLKVQLMPEPDADESDKRPGSVRYLRPFPTKDAEMLYHKLGAWTLLRNSRRGWDTRWEGWRWFRGEAGEQLLPQVEKLLYSLPETVYAIRSERQGVALYLVETGDVSAVDGMAATLDDFVVQG